MSKVSHPKLNRAKSETVGGISGAKKDNVDGPRDRPNRPRLKRSLSENVRLDTEQRRIKVGNLENMFLSMVSSILHNVEAEMLKTSDWQIGSQVIDSWQTSCDRELFKTAVTE